MMVRGSAHQSFYKSAVPCRCSLVWFKDAGGGDDHGGSFFLVVKERSHGGNDAPVILHPDGGTRAAELRGDGFKISGVWPDEHGNAGLERFDHVLAAVMDRAGETLSDEGERGPGIPRVQFSRGIE